MTNPYVHVTAAKLKRDKQSYDAHRQVDQQLHDQAHKARTDAMLKLAAEDLACWREDEIQVSSEADQALAESREAEDKALEAAEYAQEAARAHRRIKDTGSPREVTEALTAAQNAARVAQERGRKAEEAARSRENTNALLAASREQLALAELRHSQAAVKAPAGTAPVSDTTIAANHAYMQRDEIWDHLDRVDQERVTKAARKVRTAKVSTEEAEAFYRWFDNSLTESARKEAIRQGALV